MVCISVLDIKKNASKRYGRIEAVGPGLPLGEMIIEASPEFPSCMRHDPIALYNCLVSLLLVSVMD